MDRSGLQIGVHACYGRPGFFNALDGGGPDRFNRVLHPEHAELRALDGRVEGRDGLLGRRPHDSVISARMVIEMDRVPSQPVKDPPNLVRAGSFSLDRLLSHIDPGTAEECEDFVRRIYEQRHIDLSSDGNGKTGR